MPSTKQYFVGIDLGTGSGAKMGLFENHNKQLAERIKAFPSLLEEHKRRRNALSIAKSSLNFVADSALEDLASVEKQSPGDKALSSLNTQELPKKSVSPTSKPALGAKPDLQEKTPAITEEKLTSKNKQNPMIWIITGIAALAAIAVLVTITKKKIKNA
jgi:hypothetical protein